MGVNITLANGQLGQTIQTDDGIVGMVMTGGIDGTGDYALGTPILVTSPAGLTAAGITTDGNAFAVRQIQNFYAKAGAGAQLYLMLVPNTQTVADMADVNNMAGARKLLDYAAGKIKVLGIMSDPNAAPITQVDALDEKVYEAITNAQELAQAYYKMEMPYRTVIGGTGYTGVPADLADLTTRTDNRVAVLIGDVEVGVSSATAALGILMGRIASIPVQRMVSRVADGAMTDEALLSGEFVQDVPYDAAIIEGKGFITWKTYPHAAGFYFSGDRMATGDTDDYSQLARGRIIDKAHILAYKTYLQVVDDEVPVDADTGKLDAAFCVWLQGIIENQINNAMRANKEIVSVTAFVDPNQDVLSTNEIAISVGIVPYGYSRTIEVTLGFRNPALA